MPVRLHHIVIDAHDLPGLARFWTQALGWKILSEREKPADLLIAVRGAGGEVNMHAVLDRLGVGDWHEADADRCVLVGPDDDLVLALGQDLPAERLRPEPGQAGQITPRNWNSPASAIADPPSLKSVPAAAGNAGR